MRRRTVPGSRWLLAAVLAATLAPAGLAAAQNIEVIDQRNVCVLPRPNNNGKVLGHDSGWSFDGGGDHIYHFFGDTYVDRDLNGVISDGDFGTGTVARVAKATLDPSQCVEPQYKTQYSGNTTSPGYAVPALRKTDVGAPENECLTWPESGVRAAGKFYVFYTSVQKEVCGTDEPAVYEVGIAEMDADMKFTRKGFLWTGNDQRYSAPLKIGTNVYVFGTDAFDNIAIARVPGQQILNKAAYVPLAHSWVQDPNATPGPVNVAYNATLNRLIAVYSCTVNGVPVSGVCARAAATAGNSEAALLGSWMNPIVLRDCGYTFGCGHVGQHPGYANGSRIYVSTARHDGAFFTFPPRPEHRYWNTLREYDLSLTQGKPAYRKLGDSELEFSGSMQGANDWYFRRTTANGTPLTYDASLLSWKGNQIADGLPAPRIFADGQMPGPTHDTARSRRFRTAGTVKMTYEARLQENCGDGVTLHVERLRNGVVTPMQVPINLDPGWGPTRGTVVHNLSFSVLANDQIVFRTNSRGSAMCDSTVLFASYTYDATG